jgi:hypothetical protein
MQVDVDAEPAANTTKLAIIEKRRATFWAILDDTTTYLLGGCPIRHLHSFYSAGTESATVRQKDEEEFSRTAPDDEPPVLPHSNAKGSPRPHTHPQHRWHLTEQPHWPALAKPHNPKVVMMMMVEGAAPRTAMWRQWLWGPREW